jgi:hypothetical protein
MLKRGLFLGAAMLSAAAAHAENKCAITHLNQASLENVAVMPIVSSVIPTTSRDASGQTDRLTEAAVGLAEGGLPSGGRVLGYTRLRLEFTPCETDQLRHYGQESRSAIERFFVGKVDNHVLKFDVDIEPLGVKSSSQLYSMLRNSAKDGQTWTTDIRNNDYLLPYFRLDTSSVLNFSANFQSEGSSNFDIAGTVLDIIEQGSKLITPSAVLITDENRTRFNDAADFVDGSLSRLFYKKVTETARTGIAVEPTETSEQHLASIVLIAPDPRKTYIAVGWPQRVIGRWDIYAEKLRQSLFAEVHNGVADIAELDSATVLNFKIGDKDVLRDRLAASEAISKATKAMAQASDATVDEPAIGFCRLVAMEAAKVGFAPHDTAIAAWAFLEDQAMKPGKTKAAQVACNPVLRILRLPS